MIEFIIDNMQTFQIMQIINIPLMGVASFVVTVASIKYLLK